MTIDFVTSESLEERSGGWSGMNYNLFLNLKEYFRVNYIGPVKPGTSIFKKVVSKLLRHLHLKGNFYFFSEKRLEKINKIVENAVSTETDIVFFHGSTPWIKINTGLPYYAYLDASFHTFLHPYQHRRTLVPRAHRP